MKSTYKLLGVLWDHQPLPGIIDFCNPESVVQNYTADRNLFDLDVYSRRIPVSFFLKQECREDMDKITDTLSACDIIYLDIDYVPKSRNYIFREFYIRRLLQIYECLKRKYPLVKIKMANADMIEKECIDYLAAQTNAMDIK